MTVSSLARDGLHQIGAREIEAELRARVDSLVPELLSDARPDGGFWCAGSVAGEAGQSLKVNRRGPRQGLWTDFSAAEGSDSYSGDMLQLVAAVKFGGWSIEANRGPAIGWAKSWLGWDNLSPDRFKTIRREAAQKRQAQAEAGAREQEKRRESAGQLWHSSFSLPGTPALAYLLGRVPGLERLGRLPASLRFHPEVWCPVRRAKHPAMVACIIALSGELLAVHRTYLDLSAGKGGPVVVWKLPPDAKGRVKSHKQTLGQYQGGCIPLWKGACGRTLREIAAGTPVDASEGVEDGLTIALACPDKRIVAGVALANLGGLDLPPQAGPFSFIGQNDENPKTIAALERAVARQQERAAQDGSNRAVRTYYPDPAYKDFNDQLLGKRKAA